MLTDEQYEKDLAEYLDICRQLEVPAVYGRLKCESFRMPDYPNSLNDIVAMENDGVLKPLVYRDRPMRSWTRNLYNFLAMAVCSVNNTDAATFGDGHLNSKRPDTVIVGNTSVANGASSGASTYQQTTYGNDTTQGIWVGTNGGATTESIDNYVIDTQIAHGDGAGQLRYWNMLAHLYTWDGSARQWTITIRRHFTNHTGGNVTINEICLMGRVVATAWTDLLMARDVLASPVVVGDLELFRVDYSILSGVYPS